MTASARHAFEDTRTAHAALVPLTMHTSCIAEPEAAPRALEETWGRLLTFIFDAARARTRRGTAVRIAALGYMLGRESGSLARTSRRLGVSRQALWKAAMAVRSELGAIGIALPPLRYGKKKARTAETMRAKVAPARATTSIVPAASSDRLAAALSPLASERFARGVAQP